MRAATIRDGSLVIEDHPDPVPEAGELLVKMYAAGINAADIAQLQGHYPAPPGAPSNVPGLELAGEVVACGRDVFRFDVGDRVMGLVAGGGQAELALIHERVAMPVPDELDWTAAGCIPEAYTTAHDAIFTQAGLAPGERLLVNGAAGGVGTAAIQIGHMAGARVTASVRDERARSRVAALGVSTVSPEELIPEGSFDVILELVGAPNMTQNIEALAVCGRICVIGISGGSVTTLNLSKLMRKRARIYASTLRVRPLEEKALAARKIEKEVLPGFSSGDLSVPVMATFPLDKISEAYEAFQIHGKFGKIVVTI